MGQISLSSLLEEEEEDILEIPEVNPLTPPEFPIETVEEGQSRVSLSELIVDEETFNSGTISLNSLESFGPTSIPSQDSATNIYTVLDEIGRPLLREDIVSDPRLMEVVYDALEARYQPASTATQRAGRVALAISGADIGGLSGRDYRSMEPEEAFNIFQNYQRSFAGGHTVTTTAELTFGIGSDDDTQKKLGAGYLLFDSMDNVITGEGSWGEMGGAILDYTKAAVWDPSTILSLGVGRALSHAGSKAAATALRSQMIAAYSSSINKGVSNTAARAAIGAAVGSAKYAIPDAAIAMGVDVAYQSQLIQVGNQEEYNRAQTALAAAGGMVIPALQVGAAGVGQLRSVNKYFKGTDLDQSVLTVSGQEALAQNQRLLNRDIIVDHVDSQFGAVSGTTKNWKQWDELKDMSREAIANVGEIERRQADQNAFYRYLWFGDKEGGQKGFYEVLNEAGFRVTPSMKEEFKTTGVFAQALKFLDDKQAKTVIEGYEKGAGVKLGITKTSEGLATRFTTNASDAGSTMWISSQLNQLGKLTKNGKDIADALADTPSSKDLPRRAQFALSVYKRLLTSSLSTTGVNLKGFGLSTVYNSAADIAVSAINMSQAGYYKLLKGDPELAVQYFNRSKGSLIGSMRRGVSAISPELEMKFGAELLENFPKYKAQLFMDISADGGVREAFETFNLSGLSKGWKVADTVTKGAQVATLGRWQDEVTKLWAFGNNANQAIMREYGVDPSTFFKRPDVALEIASDRFQKNVVEKATYRALRETSSVNWNTLPADGAMRGIAKGITSLSTNPISGYILPFGNFVNTNLAMLGDLTGVNAVRLLMKKATGKEIDYITQEGAEVLGKAVVGWSAIAMAYHGVGSTLGAKEKVEQGYTYNQHIRPDGTIEDTQYDGFNAGIQVIAQAIAHGLDGRPLSDLSKMVKPDEIQDFLGRIPSDVWTQIGIQTGGQIFRDVDDLNRTVFSAGAALSNGDLAELGTILSAFPSRVFQGATRPLEPIDQLYGLLSDSNMNPDLRQGPGNLYNSLRYLDNLTGISETLPTRATSTRGYLDYVDVGKQILGVRSVEEPVLYERMLNSAGVSVWNAVRFQVPPEVKNTMDAMAAPLFEYYATQALRNEPDFFTLPQAQKEDIISQVRSRVQTTVVDQMKNGAVPASLDLFRVLSTQNKGQVSEILDFIGESSLEEIAEREDAYETLKKVQMLLDEYDTIFRGETLNILKGTFD